MDRFFNSIEDLIEKNALALKVCRPWVLTGDKIELSCIYSWPRHSQKSSNISDLRSCNNSVKSKTAYFFTVNKSKERNSTPIKKEFGVRNGPTLPTQNSAGYANKVYLKVIREFFLKHNKSFRWHLGDYEKHNFFPFEGLWEEKLWFLCVFTDL